MSIIAKRGRWLHPPNYDIIIVICKMHLISNVGILFPLKLQDIGEIEKNLEKRQVEILKNLRRLNKEAWLLKQGYSLVANQIKDQNFNASANQNIENDAQTAASKSEENDLQSAANQSQVQVTTDQSLFIFQNYMSLSFSST